MQNETVQLISRTSYGKRIPYLLGGCRLWREECGFLVADGLVVWFFYSNKLTNMAVVAVWFFLLKQTEQTWQLLLISREDFEHRLCFSNT